jgi:hypothetical protein
MSRKAGGKGGRDTRFQRGHDPKRNVTKPGTGRPSNEFYAMCAGASDRGAVAVIEYLDEHRDPADPVWRWCFGEVTKFSRSQAPLRSELAHEVASPAVPPPAFVVTADDGAVLHYVEIRHADDLESLRSSAIRALVEQGAKVYLTDHTPDDGTPPQAITITEPRPLGALPSETA